MYTPQLPAKLKRRRFKGFRFMGLKRNAAVGRIAAALLAVLALATPHSAYAENWPQAAGPHANWQVEGSAPVRWSVANNENIVWRRPLPEGGQSAVTIWGERLFFTCHDPIRTPAEATASKDIICYCASAVSGETLWTAKIPGSVAVGVAGIFSDATVFAPVTDGEHVWFFNRSGSIGCFDFAGKTKWIREYVPRNRHTNRQCEPILFGDQIITLEVADKKLGGQIRRHDPVPQGIEAKAVWTYLHGLDKRTGKVLWTESVGTVCHNTPMFGRMSDGTPAIVHARGGGHGPLEKPYGVSLTSLAPGKEGQTLWSSSLPKLDPSFNSHWDQEHVYVFHGKDHVLLDSKSGTERSRRSLHEDVRWWKHELSSEKWNLAPHATVKVGRSHANTNQANIVVGTDHYFLAHDIFAVGRVKTATAVVEFLDVPAQLKATTDKASEWLWTKNDIIPIDTSNSQGIDIASDKRARRSGWGHVSAASPIRIGRYLYFPVMTGTVYVIDTTADELNQQSLVAINDLGPTPETWTLSSLSFSNGRIYTRTMKELICIGER
jgi:outer membrane protein assembly factor BamB